MHGFHSTAFSNSTLPAQASRINPYRQPSDWANYEYIVDRLSKCSPQPRRDFVLFAWVRNRMYAPRFCIPPNNRCAYDSIRINFATALCSWTSSFSIFLLHTLQTKRIWTKSRTRKQPKHKLNVFRHRPNIGQLAALDCWNKAAPLLFLLQEKSENHRTCCYHLVEASCLVSGAANKQKKNYSGFRRPVSDRLWLLRRHTTHAHLDAWRKDKPLREITLYIAEIFRTCLFRFLQFLEKFTLQTNKHGRSYALQRKHTVNHVHPPLLVCSQPLK